MIENKLIIFHITKNDGTPVFLYPFNKKNNLASLHEASQIIGLYGKEPGVESLTMLRNELYRLVELAVKDWRAEKRFIPRFLISSGVFLIVYFLMSFAIRDPIPMIDETIGGFIASLITYTALVRRDYGSRIPTEMRIRLRKKIDEIAFHFDEFTNDLEHYFQTCESSSDMEELLEKMLSEDNANILNNSDKEKVESLLSSLEIVFLNNEIKRNTKRFFKLKSKNDKSSLLRNKILRWMSKRKVNPFLFALYVGLAQK